MCRDRARKRYGPTLTSVPEELASAAEGDEVGLSVCDAETEAVRDAETEAETVCGNSVGSGAVPTSSTTGQHTSATADARRPSGRKRRKSSRKFDPRVALFWASMTFSDFVSYEEDFRFEVDYDAWAGFFADAFDPDTGSVEALERLELDVQRLETPFACRLRLLREDHADWPFVRGNLRSSAWLRILSEDPDPTAADLYFAISRGFTVLPPDLARRFEPTAVDNYKSALEHADIVDEEIERLLQKGFLAEWTDAAAELGLDPESAPTVVLAIGAVLRKGKVRIVIDASAPRGSSVNDAMDPPDTILVNIAMAMACMSRHGRAWKADFTDAFLQTALHGSSVPLCAIRWNGKLYVYKRLGFGFRSGPSHQQTLTIAVVRALSRRLQRRGLSTAEPPALSHHYPHLWAEHHQHRVNGILAFLDDVGSFCSSPAAAWYSFATYLLLCQELSLGVALKPGKTDGPGQVLHYLGINCDLGNGVISLDEARLAELRKRLAAVDLADKVSVRELQSLAGVLVFCSVVIPTGKTHYHALFDAIADLGPHPPAFARVQVSEAVRESIRMWSTLLGVLNGRSARAPVLRPSVPTEVVTDASLDGWGWAGMGLCAAGVWPEDWRHRLGPVCQGRPDLDVRRIFICEAEIWALLFACRALIPRCPGSRLTVRVDNKPVVNMVQRLACRSKACRPILAEIAWLAATWDVAIDCVWIDTLSNALADALSRKHTAKHDAAELQHLMREFKAESAPHNFDVSWPPARPVRPELLKLIPVAKPEDFSACWAALPADDLRVIFPRILHASGGGLGSAGQ